MERSETFDRRRFCRYFSHEAKKTVRGQGIFILLASLVPAMLFLFYWTMSLLMEGPDEKMNLWSSLPIIKIIIASITFVLFFLIFPILRYGHLTSKTGGREDILLPVSGLEKFLSMILICIIAVPLAFMAIYFSTDLIFTQITPESDIPLIQGLAGKGFFGVQDGFYSLDNVYIFFYPYMISSAGLAGGLLFKKHKIPFTFLTCVISFILFYSIVLNTVILKDSQPFDVAKYIVPVWSTIQTIVAVICCTYVWTRIKSIQL